MSHVVLLAPRLPEGGGLAHHTRRLATQWRADGHAVTVEATLPADAGIAARGWREAGVEAVLIQYVPFLFARFGVSPAPLAVARAARRASLRTAVFVHEPWVPPTRLPWLVLSPLQRRQLRRLVGEVDLVVTPVPAWQALLPGAELAYVGSTLGEPPPDLSATPALPAPVVFSPQAAGLNWDWIAAAANAIGSSPALSVLGDPSQDQGPRPAGLTCAWLGRAPADEVFRRVARARVVLAPFVDGLTGRRTSAMAALAVGSTVVSSRGPLYDPVFDGGPAHIAGSREEFAAAARTGWATEVPPEERARRQEWYRSRFGGPMLDRRLLAGITGTR